MTACHKSGGHASPTVTAAVGDSLFSSGRVTATLAYGQFSIVANSPAQDQTLTVSFTEPFQLNVPFNADFAKASVGYLTLNDTLIYNSNYGTPSRAQMAITAWDSVNHRIAGYFSGVLYADKKDSLRVTSGSFNLGYTVGH